MLLFFKRYNFEKSKGELLRYYVVRIIAACAANELRIPIIVIQVGCREITGWKLGDGAIGILFEMGKGVLLTTTSMPEHKPHFFYRNGLSIVFLSFFIAAWVAQAFFGWKQHNDELMELGAGQIAFTQYLSSGHFFSSTFENFQSEFLQMAMYVILTISLRQIGSAESKDLVKPEEVDREPDPSKKDAPGPVRSGGWQLKLYQHSLSIAFVLLFLGSWIGHLYGSYTDHNEQRMLRGEAKQSLSLFLGEPDFWFETFQNWQSEFLSVASIVILSIFLRQKGSPESKPVDAGHMETGK
ncbi:hypothetical protein CLV60_101158 [Dyadobacter jiangsuensis]|uniref:Uncharacterized protein n=2 Tax=Dyadobacter jiangsuensis TaxID=1591085 RepID=A0A2P8GII8_9BACT|nr:hypothetical protein CLV60_101158 [Dyadobacter jiangsuensis]